MSQSPSIRLQKRIADSGYCSRRKAEALMEAGKVKVNGKVVTTLGTKVSETDRIEVKGTRLRFDETPITIALHKPAGCITSKSDPHHSKTVMDLLPREFKHLKPAGRLDKDSEGLLILSSDGQLIQALTHPRHGHSKTYEVIVKGRANEVALAPLTRGQLTLDGKRLNPMEFKLMGTQGHKSRIQLILTEGRKRQIRRVLDQLGFPVLYLKRTAIGRFRLKDLEKGEHKILNKTDIESLLQTQA